jgi:hypothetical protein
MQNTARILRFEKPELLFPIRPGGVHQSSAEGQRVVFGTAGINQYDDSDNSLVEINTNSGFYLQSNVSPSARIKISSTDGVQSFDAGDNELTKISTAGLFNSKSAESGQRFEFDQTNGLSQYDGDGNLVARWGPSGLDLGTAYSSARITIDCSNGLRAYDGDNNMWLQVPTSGTTFYGLGMKVPAGFTDMVFGADDPLTCDIEITTSKDGDSLTSINLGHEDHQVTFHCGNNDAVYINNGALNLYSGIVLKMNSVTVWDGDGIALPSGDVVKVDGVQVVGAQQAHIADADGTLADITTKFNTLLAELEAFGPLASS